MCVYVYVHRCAFVYTIYVLYSGHKIFQKYRSQESKLFFTIREGEISLPIGDIMEKMPQKPKPKYLLRNFKTSINFH